jgi:uroporphyrinogen III methyltransferase/synthase
VGVRGCRVLLPRANIAPPDLTEGLARLGAEPHEVTAYLTELPAGTSSGGKQMLLDGEIDIVTFSSSSTVMNLRRLLGDDWEAVKRTTIACIGPVTAETAREAGLGVDIVAEEQTIPGMVRGIELYLETQR